MPETIQIPRAWLEGLIRSLENTRSFLVAYHQGSKYPGMPLDEYIESAKSLLTQPPTVVNK